jgi:hypothetical protein
MEDEWERVRSRVEENERDKKEHPSPLRWAFFNFLRSSPLRIGQGITKKMVGFEFASGDRIVWELSKPAQTFYLLSKWKHSIEQSGFVASPRPYRRGYKDGKRHSSLSRHWSFGDQDCISVRVDSVDRLKVLVDTISASESGLVLDDRVIDDWVGRLKTQFENFERFDSPHAEFDQTERSYKVAIGRQLKSQIRSADMVCSPQSGPFFELEPASDMELRYGQEAEA